MPSTSSSGRNDLPAVLEPPAEDGPRPSLRSVLASHGEDVCRLLEVHGAILLRGWEVATREAFAEAVGELPLRPIRDYLPAEAGREPLLGERRSSSSSSSEALPPPPLAIWPTNNLRRTGAYLSHEVLPHTENYYALEHMMHGAAVAAVAAGRALSAHDGALSAHDGALSAEPPRVIAFYCASAPWLGGETALFDGPQAFHSLPPRLLVALRRRHRIRRIVSLARLQRRHAIGQAQLGALYRACAAAGARMRLLTSESAAPSAQYGAPLRPLLELTFERAVIDESPLPPLVPPLVTAPPPRADAKGHAHDGAFDAPGAHDGAHPPRGPWASNAFRGRVAFNFGELGAAARCALLSGLVQRGLFAGWAWALHRALWVLSLRSSLLACLLGALDALPALLCQPHSWWLHRCEQRAVKQAHGARGARGSSGGGGGGGGDRRRRKHRGEGRRAAPGVQRGAPASRPLGEVLTDRQGEQIGRALAAHASCFRWRRGDVLLVDNARILHDGMPGLGPRRLWVAMWGARDRARQAVTSG